MREVVTTLLDALGLLLVAAGAAAVWPVIGWASLLAAGVVILAGSQIAARQDGPRGQR